MLWLATLACSLVPERDCLADECTCQTDSDCVMNACAYRTDDADECPTDWDCTNGFPLPAVELARLQASESGCSVYGCDGESVLCGTLTTYEAYCSWGECKARVVEVEDYSGNAAGK